VPVRQTGRTANPETVVYGDTCRRRSATHLRLVRADAACASVGRHRHAEGDASPHSIRSLKGGLATRRTRIDAPNHAGPGFMQALTLIRRLGAIQGAKKGEAKGTKGEDRTQGHISDTNDGKVGAAV